MEFEKVIKDREATRSFKDISVSDELIEKILEAGRLAPTARNFEPQRIYVVKSKEGLDKIDLCSPCRYNAPVVLLVCSDKSVAWSKPNYSSYEMDATIAATHMILEATNVGVDNIWVMMFDNDKIKEEFNLGENIEPICLIPIGYRSDDCPPSSQHNIRKDLSELVQYI
jgi:nitroreductase